TGPGAARPITLHAAQDWRMIGSEPPRPGRPDPGPDRRTRGMTALPEDFFQAGALDLAVRLLNTELVRLEEDGSETAGRIVEVEAYAGPEDRAAHSYSNRRTARTEAMYGPAGRAY